MGGLTTKQLEEQTGVTRHQLARWVKQGLLPQSEITWGPNGRGRQGVWSPEAVATVRYIDEQASGGATIAQIAQGLRVLNGGEDAEAEALRASDGMFDRWRTPGSAMIADAPTVSVVDELARSLADDLERELGISRVRCERLAARGTRDDQVRAALFHRCRGAAPVFFFQLSVDRVDVVPDYGAADVVTSGGQHYDSLVSTSAWFVVLFDAVLATMRRRVAADAIGDMPARRLFSPRLVDEITADSGWRYQFQPAFGERYGAVMAYERAQRLREWDRIEPVETARVRIPRHAANRKVSAKKRRKR